MSESEDALSTSGTGEGFEDVPDDIRHMKDFPSYDASLEDTPQFRQKLLVWSNKTEKMATALNQLSDAFSDFHSTGVKHYQSACAVLDGMQQVAKVCENSSATVSSNLQQFTDSLNKIWCYYDAFLAQTQMITVEPVRKLAKTFTGLKKLFDEVLKYRSEYVQAADKLCACRHTSKLTDPHQFFQLAEACYSAHKTYRLVLSKYIVCMREAHTVDMMSFIRRLIEHLLSIYSHHNFSTQVLKEIESQLNELFSETKKWRHYYTKESEVWTELQRHVQDHVISSYQHQVSGIPSVDTGHGRLAEMLKPIKKMLPVQHPQQPTALRRCESEQWTEIHLHPPSPSLSTEAAISEEGESLVKSYTGGDGVWMPKVIEHSFTELPSPLGGFKRKLRLMRSNSDPDVLIKGPGTRAGTRAGTASSGEELEEEGSGFGERRYLEHQLVFKESEMDKSGTLCRSRSHDELTSTSTDDKETTIEVSLETAAKKIEEVIGVDPHRSHHRPLRALFKGLKKHHRRKRISSSSNSTSNGKGSNSAGATPTDSTRRRFIGRTRSVGEKKDKEERKKLHKQSNKDENQARTFPGAACTSSASNSSGEPPMVATPTELIVGVHCVSPPVPLPEARSCNEGESSKSVMRLICNQPSSWIKSGYLMLRMKLPNHTYAWSYIYCVVDRELGQLMVQEQSLHQPRELEDLQLCGVKKGTPDFIDRNFCFRVISPTSEHLFQALTEYDFLLWIAALQEGIEEAIKRREVPDKRKRTSAFTGSMSPQDLNRNPELQLVPNAMDIILSIPGNKQCADCNSSDVQWASINLGITLCIACSGVHRGLGVHVSKVRSLNLDKWDRGTVDLMSNHGNISTNQYYEACLGKGLYADIRKPVSNSVKNDRKQFIQLKYVTLAFVPSLPDSMPS